MSTLRRLALVPLSLALWACPSSTPAPVGPPPGPAPDPRAQMVQDLSELRFDRLGNPVLRWDSIPPVLAPRDTPHELLVVLVEFPDRGFDRFRGDPQQGQKLAAWYQNLLFDDDYRRVDTLSHYYAAQSDGAYHVTGKVLPPVTLPQPRAVYGAPHRPVGGDWRNDGDTEGMVEQALALAAAAHRDLDWRRFDRFDPKDFDGDGVVSEPDGYLDHFVLVFAGGGQASCQLLHQLDSFITPNVGAEALDTLSPAQRECADRIWPHRSNLTRREGKGPTIAGVVNRLGGAPLADRTDLWIRDYNMQSEYVGPDTFIHEFGHSIGLPDVYSRTSNNSTGAWEVMSSTAAPSPQNLSAWSRIQLGWLRPTIVKPPAFGGDARQVIDLAALDDPAATATRAALVVLPPKTLSINLTALPGDSGQWALYSGQGNDLNRTAELRADLSAHTGPVTLTFDAWFEIEGGWDFAYIETSTDDGQSWTRRVPVGAEHMPAKHGHDGKGSLPGFTGLSGDKDGDGKNESNPDCDPSQELAHGEDKAAAKANPCLVPSWIQARFDLGDLAGERARIRLRYYTDGAAVMRGILIDNVALTGAPVADFEAEPKQAGDADSAGWRIDGFSRSQGAHELLVPHFYVLEYRDPYAASTAARHPYDRALAEPYLRFYSDPATGVMRATFVRPRPGVLLWYYNGSHAWSENDPATGGPGQGFLLVVDANPNELPLPGLESWRRGADAAFNTFYDVAGDAVQQALRRAYWNTVCFMRSADYLPRGGVPQDLAPSLSCGAGRPAVEGLSIDNRPLMYSYEASNRLLPGPDRDAVQRAGELYDVRVRKDETSYRMRDRSLRTLHALDAPFWPEPFADGVRYYEVNKSGLTQTGGYTYPAQPTFSDADGARWLNPKLPFGGAAVPREGFSFAVQKPPADAPAGTRARVVITWTPPAP